MITKRPEYKVGIVCLWCEKPMKECQCELYDMGYSELDDEALDDPNRGHAKEINRKVER